jgi:hypothetical protein
VRERERESVSGVRGGGPEGSDCNKERGYDRNGGNCIMRSFEISAVLIVLVGWWDEEKCLQSFDGETCREDLRLTA